MKNCPFTNVHYLILSIFLAVGLSLLINDTIRAQSTTVIASGLNRPWNLVSDGSFVYWVENDPLAGKLKKISVDGGSATILATSLIEPSAIGVDDNYVYWIERNNGSNGSLKKLPKSGGEPTILATGFDNAQNFLVLDANNIYWVDGQPNGGVIKKISKSGGIVTILVSSGIYNGYRALAVDNSYLYFTDGSNNIKTVPINGGIVNTIGKGSPSAIVLYGDNLYWVEYNNGVVCKMPKIGGTSTTICTGTNNPAGIATDGTNVYWIEFSNPGHVFKIPVNGGSVTTLSNSANTIGVAVDNQNVYWCVNITSSGMIQKYPISVSYGTLSVLTTPVNGDIWVDGDKKGNGSWSGQTQTGSRIISFGNVQGYTKPIDTTVAVNANQTTNITGIYTSIGKLSVRIDSVMVTQTTIDQEGTRRVTRKRIDLNKTQIEVRQRQELRFVATCFDGNVDVTSSSKIDWYSDDTMIGSGRDINLTDLMPKMHLITVKATYKEMAASSVMSNAVNIIPYPEIHLPYLGSWHTGFGGNYYNWNTHAGEFALDFNYGNSGTADWGLPVIAPISGTIIGTPNYVNSKITDESIYNNISVATHIKSGGIRIQSDNTPGFLAVLRHMTAIFVHIGDHVNQGQLIGLNGSVDATSPHLHWDMWKEVKSTDGTTTPPEPFYDGNGKLIQQIIDDTTYDGQEKQTPDNFFYKSEQQAIISGSVQATGILGYNNNGKLSLTSQTTATYSLGYFSAYDRLDQIGLFIPFNRNEGGISGLVPNPPSNASARLILGNSVVTHTIQIKPAIKKGMFCEIVPTYVLPNEGNVFLELSGIGLVFDEVRFQLKPAGGGGTESPRIIITKAELSNKLLNVDVFNPYSEMQTLSKMDILQTTDGTDTLSYESDMLNVNVPSNSKGTLSIPGISLSDTLQAILKIITKQNIYDIAYIDLTSVARVVDSLNIPTVYLLNQNYPNPFNGSTIIEYSLPKKGNVKIVIIDMLGRVVSTLVDEEKTPGTYRTEFEAGNVSSGVYFYRMQTNEFVQTKKLVLLR